MNNKSSISRKDFMDKARYNIPTECEKICLESQSKTKAEKDGNFTFHLYQESYQQRSETHKDLRSNYFLIKQSWRKDSGCRKIRNSTHKTLNDTAPHPPKKRLKFKKNNFLVTLTNSTL